MMGIKGLRSRLAARRAQQKTHRTRSCLSAQGQLLRVWRDRDRRYIAGFLAWKQGRKIYGSTVRVVQEQVLYLSAGGPFIRKEGTEGQKGVRKTNRAAKSGPCPKDRDGPCTPRSPQAYSSLVERSKVHLKDAGSIPARASQRVYGFRKENRLIVLKYEHL